jgi:FixJ family two-component response regulator
MTTGPSFVHVVDDDAAFRAAIARLLGASGYQVALYGSASELLEKLTALDRVHDWRGYLRTAEVLK